MFLKTKSRELIVQTEVTRVILDALAHPALLPNVAPNTGESVRGLVMFASLWNF